MGANYYLPPELEERRKKYLDLPDYKRTGGRTKRTSTGPGPLDKAFANWKERKGQQWNQLSGAVTGAVEKGVETSSEVIQNIKDLHASGADWREGNRNWLMRGNREGNFTIPTNKRAEQRERMQNIQLEKEKTIKDIAAYREANPIEADVGPTNEVKGSTGSVEETGGRQEEGKGNLPDSTNNERINAETVGEQETRSPAAIQEQEQGEWGPGGQPSASEQLEAYQNSVQPSKTQADAASTMKVSEMAGKAHTVLANLANIASILDTGTGPGATLHKRPSKTDTKTPDTETVKDTKPETVDEKKWRWPW